LGFLNDGTTDEGFGEGHGAPPLEWYWVEDTEAGEASEEAFANPKRFRMTRKLLETES
jgi:hypothetical protein